MARFRYRAVGNDGAVSEDVIDAPDREAAIAQLWRTERRPVEVVPVGEERHVNGLASRARRKVRPSSREEHVRFTRELATMLAADVSVDRALEVLAQPAGNNALASVAGTMRARVREGQSLAQAAAAHPKVFSPFYCATLRAGEAGGRLAEALTSLARYQERMAQLVNAVQSALIYPTLLALAALVSLVVLLVYVVPQFDQLFREAAATMGASPRRVWREVDVPIASRAVVVGAAFAFAISVGEFGATTFLARPQRPTVPTAIFRLLGRPGDLAFGQAMALSVILMLITGTAVLVIEKMRVVVAGEL